MTLLSLEHVTKRFPAGRGEVAVLEGASMEVGDGEVVAVHGTRGSGKSTLLRIAAGWELPDEGRVLFEGRDLCALSDRERTRLRRRGGIGLVLADRRPSVNRSALEHVQEVLLCDGASLRTATVAAHRALERVGLAGEACTFSSRLSQGELIRLGLAERLVHSPCLLLVDDPMAMHRSDEAAEMYELLRSLAREPELALVIATDELAPVRMAARVFSLDHGRLRSMDGGSGQLLSFDSARVAARRS